MFIILCFLVLVFFVLEGLLINAVNLRDVFWWVGHGVPLGGVILLDVARLSPQTCARQNCCQGSQETAYVSQLTVHTTGSQAPTTQAALKLWARSFNQGLLGLVVGPSGVTELGAKAREKSRFCRWLRRHKPD